MRRILFSTTMVATLLSGATAFAGAGANFYACVYLAVRPAQPITFNFKAGGTADHCMYKVGHDASLAVDKAGVSCTGVGYVEEKGSSSGGDLCATDTSTWVLGYSSSEGDYSGSVESHMSHPLFSSNHIKLGTRSPDTYVCSQANLCNATSLSWDSGTQGPLYMIFEPGAHN